MINPVFSVIVPLYNKQAYIESCIDSVLSQTYPLFELIVVDDGSTDQSAAKVKRFDDSRVRYIYQSNNGVSAARNTGIKAAGGQYIAFLDADDWYEKSILEEFYKLSLLYPSADALACGYFKHKNGSTTRSSLSCLHESEAPRRYVIDDFYSKWTDGAFFCASSCAVKSKYFHEHDVLFKIGESMGEDQELWFHIAEHGVFAFINKPLSNYNMGVSNSLSFGSKRTDELPFITRLKNRIDSETFAANEVSARRFVSQYDLERSFNNSLFGSKRTALYLLCKNANASGFLKLKLICLIGLFMPRVFIAAIRKLVNIKNDKK